jgi:hypothetical protein
MSKEYITVGDISKMEGKLKSHHALVEGITARLEQQSRAIAETIAGVQLSSETAHLAQTYQFPLDTMDKVAHTVQAFEGIGNFRVKSFVNDVSGKLGIIQTLSEQLIFQINKLPVEFPRQRSAYFQMPYFNVAPLNFPDFNPAIKTFIEHFTAQADQFQRAITIAAEQLRIPSYFPELLEISQDGAVNLGGESASALEVNETVEGLFSLIHEPDFLDSIWERLKEFKIPIQAIILWILDKIFLSICIGIIINMITPHIQSYFDKFSFMCKREVTQAIKSIPHEININAFRGFRVVTGDRLRLRENPSMKAKILGELHRGKIVRVIEKRRNWTLVEVMYEDSTGGLQGWVATRYIAVLRR